MGLDATVYCNCYEMGKLKSHPPRPELLYVDANGRLGCDDGGDDEIFFAFTHWLNESACDHKGGVAVHHRIGNLALVVLLRKELARYESSFPLMLSKVLYNAFHGGDFIEVDQVKKMRQELIPLSNYHASDAKTELFLRDFEQQMSELISMALYFNKPISF